MLKTIRNIFLSTINARALRNLVPLVQATNSFEPAITAMTDQELKDQTSKFKKMIAQGQNLKTLLPEAFATVREASRRTLGLRHFDVQIMGGLVLFEGKIAEMKTGEGKTLCATLPLYLHGLTGLGVHLVTVNDYLAQRDAKDMGHLLSWLGLSVGCIVTGSADEERRKAYMCDVTYGTNNEFAFDYLRDNMKHDLAHYVQRKPYYCIVDEVDSILIDEARTPLIISGAGEGKTDLYKVTNTVITRLKKGKDYTVEEKTRSAVFADEGVGKIQKMLNIDNLYKIQHADLLNHLIQSLKAHALFRKDVDYVVRDRAVIIVDEFTGRLKEGSRWSDGLHQAVEAKENVPIKSENQTLATTTFQNYFRLYRHLAGMTGTAATESAEFMNIYRLDVCVIPTNMPMIRTDSRDTVYKTEEAKYKAVAKYIQELYKKGQPVLVGTTSIEKSEKISALLRKSHVPHMVLNAKQNEHEAKIVANAGQKGAVTIATNMAGRGTDIKLCDETVKLGGFLFWAPNGMRRDA